MRYPVDIQPDGPFFLVTFPDIPEAITQGESREQALAAAAAALETALDLYFEDHRLVPLPSRFNSGDLYVELPASLSAKILLLNEMTRQKVPPAELARRLNTTSREVSRLTSLHQTSGIDGIAEAMKALGKTLEISAI